MSSATSIIDILLSGFFSVIFKIIMHTIIQYKNKLCNTIWRNIFSNTTKLYFLSLSLFNDHLGCVSFERWTPIYPKHNNSFIKLYKVNRIIPKLKISILFVYPLLPKISGAMYPGVPHLLFIGLLFWGFQRSANPKSVIFT